MVIFDNMVTNRSIHNGKLICKCSKGYASENPQSPNYLSCKPCYIESLTCSQRRKLGLKLP